MQTRQSFTLAEAARRIGITKEALGRLIKRYGISCDRFGRQVVVTTENLKEIKRCRRAAIRIRMMFGTKGQAAAKARAQILNDRNNGDGARG